ncbi:MAG: hypothetical protein RLZZ387_5005 [Chloroflexota bacterium]|jgi:hypothetical protein
MAYVHEASEPLTAPHERVDDIPLLVAHLQRMGVPSLLDAHIPPRRYWGSLSPGWVATIWLTHMLSQSDGKLRHVQPWVAAHGETLRRCIGQDVLPASVNDLRLRDVLQVLADDARWHSLEVSLNRHVLGEYGLPVEQVHAHQLDSNSWQVQPEGLLQVGQGRGWKPGTIRLRIVQATLEPYGLPLTTWASPARGSEPPLALLIAQAQSSIQGQAVLYSGGELSAVEARAAIHAAGDAYLCLFSEAAGGDAPDDPLPFSIGGDDQRTGADGHEWRVAMSAECDGRRLEWEERRLRVRSRGQARVAEDGLRARLTRAREALAALGERKRGKRRPRTLEALQQAAHDVLETYHVHGLLDLQYWEAVEERVVRRYRGRPTSVRIEREMQVTSTLDEAAVNVAVQQLGWRLFATNLPLEALPLEKLAQTVSPPPTGFERLSGRPISLTSGNLQREENAVGLVRLLSLALRALVLLEVGALQHLALEVGEAPGQAIERRRAAQQAGERLLETFRDIMLVGRGSRGGGTVTLLTPLQRRVLHLLSLPPEIYQL